MAALAPLSTIAERSDSLGCSARSLKHSQELQGSDFSFYRKRVEGEEIAQVVTPASDRGFLLGISLAPHRRSIFRGRQGAKFEFAPGAIYTRDFSEDYRADLQAPFDFLLVEMPLSWFAAASDELRRRRVAGLATVTGQHDPVLQHLAYALTPALANPDPDSRLFIDQLGVALGTHLLQRYGGAPAPTLRTAPLSRLHEERAKMMLLEKVKGNVSIPEIARECNMSASYFLRAFKASTGHTPHQWLMVQRVEMAQQYLRSTQLTLAEIALACDFYDQSHFSRVFSQVVGSTPGAWRRRLR
ncbi:helix-turn-helix transcriptional regulator [Herbaspirillum seropedicae]|uniref:AraC family transcription regulator protein n=1 Tax=Herbaspirillum seropedicae (strain SmR1) TaxID=757424 RepID=D8IWV4_HERSS|nr:AraC family transcriptional regulator [Herbaspirillum seropedicae]ADJ65991.1 AraC family transcription regulator protein [Herbaspirillum seropedicae SmR1]AKN67764.1 AraC family transcriptional regulator [Herbaspirillum seropedicae]MDR6398208.1 AraC-like DNA-binding protein [Herbaspirillum seropedicae]NQE29803.1 AraC family transcriptional regulator [Herbaspirillum seropedicae]UMU23792.1 helix-turn-helix transcriptional regulator [Herbaspirillum seropedicae]